MREPRAFYNEIDPYAAQWLRNLIAAGLIAPGDVDERSIVDVRAADLVGFTQCHFFAGIGGWSYALRLAGWADDRPAWTGSCPCQPLSSAGTRQGYADERHLWPAFHGLIAECRPPVVFGEQVTTGGPEWLAAVRCDLEDEGYAVGCAYLEALCFGSHQARERLVFVADRVCGRQQEPRVSREAGCLVVGDPRPGLASPYTSIECADGKRRGIEPGLLPLAHGISGRMDQVRAYGNAIVPQVAAEFIRAYLETERMTG